MSNYNNLNCCNTIKNCHCSHCNPICTEQSFIQLYDRTLVNELTESVRFLSLSNDKMNGQLSKRGLLASPNDQSFSTGGYTISTTTIKNDTLNLPGPGIYQISLRLVNHALSNGYISFNGKCVPLTYSVIAGGNDYFTIPSCMVKTVDIGSDLMNDVLLYTLYRSYGDTPNLRIYLKEFPFEEVLNNKLIVDNMILVVQKLQSL